MTDYLTVVEILAINGATITAGGDDIYKFIIGLYEARTFDFQHLKAWLRTNVT